MRAYISGVHVNGRPGAALNRIDDELIVELSADYVISSARDGVGDPGLEVTGVAIGECRRFLYDGPCAGECRVNAGAGDRKVLRAAQCLHAVVGARGNLALADEVVLYPKLVRCHSLLSFYGGPRLDPRPPGSARYCNVMTLCHLATKSNQGVPTTRNASRQNPVVSRPSQ